MKNKLKILLPYMTSLAAFTKGEDSDGHFVALTAQA